ncbi:MAG: DMT family transporter [Bacteroidales bacterium]
MNQRKAYIFALLAIVFWSTVASAFKLSLNCTNVPTLLWLSSVVSLMVLVVVVVWDGSIKLLFQFPLRQILLSMFLGLLNPFIYYLVLFTAYSMLPAQEAMTLNYTWPLVLALLSAPVLKQKLTIKSLLALLISFAGIVIISTQGQPFAMEFENKTGTALALGSSVIWALFWLFNVKSHLPETLKLFLNFFWGSLYLSAYLLMTETFEL